MPGKRDAFWDRMPSGGQSMFWDGFQWVPRADTGRPVGGRQDGGELQR